MATRTTIPTDERPVSRSDRRAQHSKAILAAAHQLVAEQGEDFTTEELIKEAGVARQTFYRHYKSKDQLLLAVITEMIAGHCRGLAEAGRAFDDPVDRFGFYVMSTLEAMRSTDAATPRFLTSQHWRLHQEFPEQIAAATRPFTDLIVSVLAEGRATGALHPRDIEEDAWLVTKMVMAVFHHYAFAVDDPGLETAAGATWRFCLAAVGGSVPD